VFLLTSAAVPPAHAQIIDTFTLPAGPTAVDASVQSNVSLREGRIFTVRVSGTFLIGGASGLADAEYFNIPATPLDRSVQGVDIGVQIDGVDIDWGPFNPTHVYETTIIGEGAPINVSFNDTNHGDNSGSLSVEILPSPAAATVFVAAALVITRRRRG